MSKYNKKLMGIGPEHKTYSPFSGGKNFTGELNGPG